MNVTIFYDALDPIGNRETIEGVDDLCAFLTTKFDKFPEHAKIYLDHVADACEVTPQSDADIERLQKMDGHFFVVVYPGGPIIIGIIIAIVLAAASIALTFLYRPNTATQQNQGSPNNALANRQNQARPNERIPDIVGTVRAVPDLLCPPYRFFNANQEIEDCFLCIGRKSFAFYQTTHDATGVALPSPLWDIKDDLTPIQEEAGASVEVWAPYTSPNPTQGGTQTYTPQIRIGAAINTPAYIINASASVVGQILRPPNDQRISSSYSATYDGKIECSDSTIDLTQYFAAGDTIYWDCNPAHDPGSSATADVSGTYRVLAIDTSEITLDNPPAVNAGWNAIAGWTGKASTFEACTVSSAGSKWVGPFVLNIAQVSEVWCNFVAPQGLFKVSSASGNQYRIDVDVQIGIQAVDAYQQPIGAEVFYQGVCTGSATQQSQRAVTIKCVLPAIGPCQVRSIRTNFTDNTWQGTNADQLQWRDLYAVTIPTEDNYGNVTCVQTRTVATASALTAKSRKLNMLVTANVPMYNPLTTQFSMTASMPFSFVGEGDSFTITATFANASAGLPTGTLTAKLFPDGPGNQTDGSVVESVPLTNGTGTVSIADSGVHLGTTLTVTYSGDATYPAVTVTLPYTVALAGATPGSPVSATSKGTYPVGPSDNAADIIAAIAFDPYLGNRAASEVDLTSIYGAFQSGTSHYDDTNLFDKTAVTLNQLLDTGYFSGSSNATGTHYAAGGFYVSDFIPIVAGQQYTIRNGDSDNNLGFGVAQYDATQTPVPMDASLMNGGSVGGGYQNEGFPIPDGAIITARVTGFMRLSSNANNLNTQMVVAGNVAPTVYIPFHQLVQGVPAGTVTSYFGTPLVANFGYTFDDANTSFEEMLSDIQQATFCTLFRRGSRLECSPELLATSGTVLFNHRNKLPGKETRTTTFGWTNNYDGIELTYVDPNAPNYPDVDTPFTLYFPSDQSALNAKKITAVGVRNNVQAYLLGSRLYNKLRYQSDQVEFTTVKSAALCITNERIIVADNTRDDVMDGYVTGINGLTLTLSQPVTLVAGSSYTIFLQDPAATVDAIAITQPNGLAANQVLLANAPASPLSTDLNNWAQTAYLIAIPADPDDIPAAMMLTEKTWADKQQYTVKAVNYDARYYGNDKDFINGVVVANSAIVAGGVGYAAPGGGGTGGGGGGTGDPGNPPGNPDPGPGQPIEQGDDPN
jgi:hypothetical protein